MRKHKTLIVVVTLITLSCTFSLNASDDNSFETSKIVRSKRAKSAGPVSIGDTSGDRTDVLFNYSKTKNSW